MAERVLITDSARMCVGWQGVDMFRHPFSDKSHFYRLENLEEKRGGLEVGFWSRCVFILGSSPIGGKSRENKIDRKIAR